MGTLTSLAIKILHHADQSDWWPGHGFSTSPTSRIRKSCNLHIHPWYSPKSWCPGALRHSSRGEIISFSGRPPKVHRHVDATSTALSPGQMCTVHMYIPGCKASMDTFAPHFTCWQTDDFRRDDGKRLKAMPRTTFHPALSPVAHRCQLSNRWCKTHGA
jgi:hypothetical protein